MAVSMTGAQMQSAAIDWHLYQITGSPLALGTAGLVRLVPTVAFSLIGGAVADAMDRRKVLICAQLGLCFVAAAMSAAVAFHVDRPWLIYCLIAIGATSVAFSNPARQAMLPNLVPKEHLYNAITVNSVTFRITMIAGPLLAGLLIGGGLLKAAYAINAVSYIGVIWALAAIKKPLSLAGGTGRAGLSIAALKEGLHFVWSTPILVWTLALDFWATFFSSADALLPIFAKDVLHVGPTGYGLLRSATAVGTLIASSVMAVRPPIVRQGRTILIAVIFYGAMTLLFGASKWFWLSWIALAAVGAADTVSTILRQTIRQLVTPDHLRGRMTSVNMIFFMGGPQLGELEAGVVAQLAGAPFSVMSGGIGCIVAAGYIWTRARGLRDYRLPTHAADAEPRNG